MNNFKDGGFKKRGDKFGGKPKFGGHRGSDNKSGGSKFGASKPAGRPADLFKAQCSTCHKDCMLPFRPNTDKPVYCSDCFSKKNADSARDDGRRDGTKPPRSERSPRHDRPQPQPNYELNAIKLQLKTIEDRLNRVLDIINPPLPAKKATPVAVVAEPVVVQKVAVKKVATVQPAGAKKVTPVKKTAPKKVAVKKAAVKKVTKTKK